MESQNKVENNISKQRATITWLQFLLAMFFVSQGVFWLTSIYKDLQFDIQRTELNRLEINDAREQSKRRIKNAEERIMLKQQNEHQKLRIEILEKEISYLKQK